jgi:hypothetical protein
MERAKETQHLDPSRATCLKKFGRTTGSKDPKPRKQRAKSIKMRGEEKHTLLQGEIGWSKTGADRTYPIGEMFTSSTGVLIDKQLHDMNGISTAAG